MNDENFDYSDPRYSCPDQGERITQLMAEVAVLKTWRSVTDELVGRHVLRIRELERRLLKLEALAEPWWKTPGPGIPRCGWVSR